MKNGGYVKRTTFYLFATEIALVLGVFYLLHNNACEEETAQYSTVHH